MVEKWGDPQFCEVHWYRRSGLHKDRIRADRTGRPYVVGDADWNRLHPDKYEEIERRMHRDGVYKDVRFTSSATGDTNG